MGWMFASTGASTALSVNFAAGTQTASTGTVVLSNSNGVTFGMSNNSQVTASFSQSTVPSAISAGTTLASSGTVVLSNSNGVSFGLNGNTITASAGNDRSFIPFYDVQSQNWLTLNSGSLSQRPIMVPINVPAGKVACSTIRLFVSGSTGATSLNVTCGFGFYTLSNSTRLNLLSSTTFAMSMTAQSLWASQRCLEFTGLSGLTLTEGIYVAALYFSASGGSSARMALALQGYNLSNSTIAPIGTIFAGTNSSSASNSSQQPVPFRGVYSATTNGFPASPGKSDISYDQANAIHPWMLFTEI